MADYRFYFLDRRGHFAQARDIECVDDADAIARARSLHSAHGIEVWQGRRLVGRVGAALGEE